MYRFIVVAVVLFLTILQPAQAADITLRIEGSLSEIEQIVFATVAEQKGVKVIFDKQGDVFFTIKKDGKNTYLFIKKYSIWEKFSRSDSDARDERLTSLARKLAKEFNKQRRVAEKLRQLAAEKARLEAIPKYVKFRTYGPELKAGEVYTVTRLPQIAIGQACGGNPNVDPNAVPYKKCESYTATEDLPFGVVIYIPEKYANEWEELPEEKRREIYDYFKGWRTKGTPCDPERLASK